MNRLCVTHSLTPRSYSKQAILVLCWISILLDPLGVKVKTCWRCFEFFKQALNNLFGLLFLPDTKELCGGWGRFPSSFTFVSSKSGLDNKRGNDGVFFQPWASVGLRTDPARQCQVRLTNCTQIWHQGVNVISKAMLIALSKMCSHVVLGRGCTRQGLAKFLWQNVHNFGTRLRVYSARACPLHIAKCAPIWY